MSYQKLEVYGVLGNNAQIKTFGDKQYLAFDLSVSNGKDAQGNMRPSTWFSCLYNYNPQTQAWLAQRLVSKCHVIAHGTIGAKAYMSTKTNAPEASLNFYVRELDVIGVPMRDDAPSYGQQAVQAMQAPVAPPPSAPVMVAPPQAPTQTTIAGTSAQEIADDNLPF